MQRRGEQRLVVFPGMELTLGVPCQALLLFDAEFPDDLFSLAMNALAITPNDPNDAKTAQTQRLDHITSLKGLKEEILDTHEYLRDRYIVLPNVTNEGQYSIFRVGLAGKYAEMPWVGAQTVQLRRLEEKSLSEQASALRASLTGLSDEEKEVLDRGKRFDMADRSVQLWRDGIVTLNERASSLRGTVNSYLEQLEEPPAEPEGSILTAAHEEYRLFLADATASLDGLIARASAIAAPTEEMDAASPWRRWSERLAQVKTAYEAAVQQSSAYSEKMKQLKDIDEQIGKHAREIARGDEELRALATAESTYVAERTSWQELLSERDDLRDQQCAALTTCADGAIRAQVRRFADPSGFVDMLRQSLSGSRVQGGKLDTLGESITNSPDPTAQWNDLLLDLEKLAVFDVDREGANRRPETPSLAACGLTTGEQDRLAGRLKSEEWLALSLTPVKSAPVFEYRTREGEYIPFRNASAGQQATALLKTLLNQAGPPLIIDQPEEDLDNPVMLEIVGRVWQGPAP